MFKASKPVCDDLKSKDNGGEGRTRGDWQLGVQAACNRLLLQAFSLVPQTGKSEAAVPRTAQRDIKPETQFQSKVEPDKLSAM